MKLSLTIAEFDRLSSAVDKARKPGSMIRVPAGEMSNLLLDHSRLLKYAQEHGFKIEEI